MNHLYFDNNATTALDPEVLEEMLKEFKGPPLNPSSQHFFGKRAKQLLSDARDVVAQYFSFHPNEVLFTASGSESVNTFIKSLKTQGHVISTEIEHSCLYKSLKDSQKMGLDVTFIEVSSFGAPEPKSIEMAIRPDTHAICLSAVNSETGVKIDLQAIAEIAARHKILLFIDAVAYVGKEPWISYPGISAVAIAAHKFHGPKGSAALLVKAPFTISPQILGGGQEMQRRAGTENLAGILGMAKALQICRNKQQEITKHLLFLRDHFEAQLQKNIPSLLINGSGSRIVNTSNISFPEIDGETFLIQLDRQLIAASHGSACASGAREPSRVLTKMGFEKKRILSSVRFSFARTNTMEEVNDAIQTITNIHEKLKAYT